MPSVKTAFSQVMEQGPPQQFRRCVEGYDGDRRYRFTELIGTTQSVNSRLEDPDYEGRSLSVLERIATALNQKLTVEMTAREPELQEIRATLPKFIQMLRRSHGLTIANLAEKTGIERKEVIALEQNPAYRPSPLLCILVSFSKCPNENWQFLQVPFVTCQATSASRR